MSETWRVGRKVGRTIYRQLGDEPSDDDPLIGVMDTAEDAAQVIATMAERSKALQENKRSKALQENKKLRLKLDQLQASHDIGLRWQLVHADTGTVLTVHGTQDRALRSARLLEDADVAVYINELPRESEALDVLRRLVAHWDSGSLIGFREKLELLKSEARTLVLRKAEGS